MVKIKRATIEGLMEASRNTYPNEFFALIGSKHRNSIIDDVIIVPAVYGKTHAIIKTSLIPIDFSIMGSIHSHPGRNNNPSRADIHSFPAFGSIHFIISYPFTSESTRSFDVKGNEIKWEAIE